MNNEAHCSTSRLLWYYYISRKRCRKYNVIEVLDPSLVLHCTSLYPTGSKSGGIVPHTPPGDAAHV